MEKPLKNSIVKRHRAPARHWQAETQFRLQLACAAMTGQKRPKRSFGMAPASEEALWIAQYVQILDGSLNEAARASGLSPSTLRNYGIYSPRRFGQEPVAPERIQAFDQARSDGASERKAEAIADLPRSTRRRYRKLEDLKTG